MVRISNKKMNIPISKQEIDIREVAKRFEKHLNIEYGYGVEDNTLIKFQFRKDNFYHFFGFEKLKDISDVIAIEKNELSKNEFFEYVLDGTITCVSSYSKGDHIVNINDSTYTSDLGQIKANRLLVFTDANIDKLLYENDSIVRYKKELVDSKIDAEYIFYELYKGSNLNLFIGLDSGKYYVVTFFKEITKNSYLVNSNGEFVQKKLDIFSVYNVGASKANKNNIEFRANWKIIRSKIYSNSSEEIKCLNKVKRMVSGNERQYIIPDYLEKQLKNLQNIIPRQKVTLEEKEKVKRHKEKEILFLRKYLKCKEYENEEEINISIKLNEEGYEIEDMNEEELLSIVSNKEKEMKRINTDFNESNSRMNKLVADKDKIEKAIRVLEVMQVRENILLYRPYINDIDMWGEEKLKKIVERNNMLIKLKGHHMFGNAEYWKKLKNLK